MNWNQLLYIELINVLTIPMEKNDYVTIRFFQVIKF